MQQQNLNAWFFEGGSVSIPKKLIGLMEVLGISHKELGEICYLLYCDNKISKSDGFSLNAVKSLKKRELIQVTETGDFFLVSFAPMFVLITKKLGLGDTREMEPAEAQVEPVSTYADTVKEIERKTGVFLSVREKLELQEAAQQYLWDFSLVGELFIAYQKNFKRQYPFGFFVKMAYGHGVKDKESLKQFIENLDYVEYKLTEIKKRLGHRRQYSEVEKETYLKWVNQWKFTHEMVLWAVEQTISAKDPSFKYIDKILENWKKEEIHSKEAWLEREKKRELSSGESKKVSGQKKADLVNKRNLDEFIE